MKKYVAVLGTVTMIASVAGCGTIGEPDREPAYLIGSETIAELAREAAAGHNAQMCGILAVTDGEIPYIVEVTSKGNGTLRIGNLFIRVYDACKNDDLFDPSCCKIEKITNGNGRCDGLTIEGSRLLLDEATGDAISRSPILLICHYDAASKSFTAEGTDAIVLER